MSKPVEWTEVALFDADWSPDDGEQQALFGGVEDDGPVKLWPDPVIAR